VEENSMNGELILTDKELARIITVEIGIDGITTTQLMENGIAYEIEISDEEIAIALKSYLGRRNTELEINTIELAEKIADANRFTFTEEEL
jgi:hypothetical protein